MRQDSTHAEGSVAFATASATPAPAGAGAGEADSSLLLPRLAPRRTRGERRPRELVLGPVAGRIALGTLTLGAFLVVLFATSRHSALVPHSGIAFPNWEAGPLHGLFGHLPNKWDTINAGFSIVVVLMLLAYVAAVAAVRTMSMKMIAIWIVAMHAIL